MARRVIIGAFIILSLWLNGKAGQREACWVHQALEKRKSTLSDRRVKWGSHPLQDKAREVVGRRQVRGIDTSSPSHVGPGSRIKSRKLYLGRRTLSGGPGMSLMVEL